MRKKMFPHSTFINLLQLTLSQIEDAYGGKKSLNNLLMFKGPISNETLSRNIEWKKRKKKKMENLIKEINRHLFAGD
jgi:hypothetical protein